MARAKGIDASAWQGDVQWEKVRAAGVDFACVKATEGRDFVDPRFTAGRVRAMHKAGLMVTMYHFARPQPGRSPRAEADHFLRTVRAAGYGQRGDLPLMLDLEWTKLDPARTTDWAVRFGRLIEDATGQEPFVYTYPAWAKAHIVGGLGIGGFPLWIANYGVDKPSVPVQWAERGWTMWQHSDRGTVDGVRGPVDLDVYRGSSGHLRERFMDMGKPRVPKPRPRPLPPAPSPHYPKDLPVGYRRLWDRPWTARAASSRGFRRWLDDHGYLTPHFTLAEARCKDGTPVPASLNRACRDHAFQLERLRHELGDQPIPILSWYRHPSYNQSIGGASKSKHMGAIATDIARGWVNAVGRQRALAACERVFRDGGFGAYSGGSIHVDSRPGRARWTTW